MRVGIVLAVVVMLAGCADAPRNKPVAPLQDVVHSFPAAATSTTLWDNGTFSAFETIPGANCVVGTCSVGPATRSLDLRNAVPESLPVRIHAAIESKSGGAPRFSLTLHAEQQFVLWKRTGENTIEALLLHDANSPLSIVIVLGPQTAPVEYVLRVDIATYGDSLPPGLAVALTVPSPKIRVETVAHDRPLPALAAWSPSDDFLGILPPSSDGLLDLGAGAGEYIIVVLGQEDARIFSVETDKTVSLRAVGLEVGESEGSQVVAAGTTSWAIGLASSEMPLQIGMALCSDDPGGVTVSNPTGSIEGPAGQVLAFHDGSLKSGYEWPHWLSQVGDSRLVPGTYTFEYAQQFGGGVYVRTVLVSYDRDANLHGLVPPRLSSGDGSC